MNLDDLSFSHIVSMILGGGGASFIARFIFDRALQTLKDITDKLENVTQKLIVVETKLDAMQEVKSMVIDHDRKIVDLQGRRFRNGLSDGMERDR